MKSEVIKAQLQEEITETVKELLDYYDVTYVEKLLPALLEK